jgi:hypothetical protein
MQSDDEEAFLLALCGRTHDLEANDFDSRGMKNRRHKDTGPSTTKEKTNKNHMREKLSLSHHVPSVPFPTQNVDHISDKLHLLLQCILFVPNLSQRLTQHPYYSTFLLEAHAVAEQLARVLGALCDTLTTVWQSGPSLGPLLYLVSLAQFQCNSATPADGKLKSEYRRTSGKAPSYGVLWDIALCGSETPRYLPPHLTLNTGIAEIPSISYTLQHIDSYFTLGRFTYSAFYFWITTADYEDGERACEEVVEGEGDTDRATEHRLASQKMFSASQKELNPKSDQLSDLVCFRQGKGSMNGKNGTQTAIVYLKRRSASYRIYAWTPGAPLAMRLLEGNLSNDVETQKSLERTVIPEGLQLLSTVLPLSDPAPQNMAEMYILKEVFQIGQNRRERRRDRRAADESTEKSIYGRQEPSEVVDDIDSLQLSGIAQSTSSQKNMTNPPTPCSSLSYLVVLDQPYNLQRIVISQTLARDHSSTVLWIHPNSLYLTALLRYPDLCKINGGIQRLSVLLKQLRAHEYEGQMHLSYQEATFSSHNVNSSDEFGALFRSARIWLATPKEVSLVRRLAAFYLDDLFSATVFLQELSPIDHAYLHDLLAATLCPKNTSKNTPRSSRVLWYFARTHVLQLSYTRTFVFGRMHLSRLNFHDLYHGVTEKHLFDTLDHHHNKVIMKQCPLSANHSSTHDSSIGGSWVLVPTKNGLMLLVSAILRFTLHANTRLSPVSSSLNMASTKSSNLDSTFVVDPLLQHCLSLGFAFLHGDLCHSDTQTIINLCYAGSLKTLFSTASYHWPCAPHLFHTIHLFGLSFLFDLKHSEQADDEEQAVQTIEDRTYSRDVQFLFHICGLATAAVHIYIDSRLARATAIRPFLYHQMAMIAPPAFYIPSHYNLFMENKRALPILADAHLDSILHFPK